MFRILLGKFGHSLGYFWYFVLDFSSNYSIFFRARKVSPPTRKWPGTPMCVTKELLWCNSKQFISLADNAPEAKHRPIDMYCINCNSQQRQWLDHHNELRRWAGASNMNELVS